jgi:hypothetical protein
MAERKVDEALIGRHLRAAHERFRGEHQIAEYVDWLEIEECARILAASPTSLSYLAGRHAECRAEAGEERDFEAVIRTWTRYVLSGLEGG